MSHGYDPNPGNWYERLDNGYRFEVVDFDEDEGLVDIQYADGSVDQFTLDDWYEQEIEASEPPPPH